MNNKIKELKEIKANLDNLSKEVKTHLEQKGHDTPEDKMYQTVNSIYNYIDYVAKNLYSSLDYCHERMSKHEIGHLPKINGAGKMESVLKKLDLADDYQVIKPALYSFASVKGAMVIEAEYKKDIRNGIE